MSSSSGNRRTAHSTSRPGRRGARVDAPRTARRAPANPWRGIAPPLAQSTNDDAELLIGASAGKAGPGFVEVMTKSACSNIAAIASLASIRERSAAAATRRLNRLSDSTAPTRISSVRSAAHPGHSSSSSTNSVAMLPIIHSAPRRGRDTAHSMRRRPRSAIERVGGFCHHLPGPLVDGDASQCRIHDDGSPCQFVGPEVPLPCMDSGQARRVADVVSSGDVVEAGGVTHRPCETAEDDGEWGDHGVGPARDAAVGALHPQKSGVARGDPDRAAPVASGRQRDQASRHGGGTPTARSTRGSAVLPGIVCHAVHLADAHVQAPELARRGRTDGYRPCRTETGDERRVVHGHPVAEDQRGFGEGPALHRFQLLDAQRKAPERQRDIGGSRHGRRSFGIEVAERVEAAPPDGFVGRLQLLDRRAFPATEGLDERAGIAAPGCVGHAPDGGTMWAYPHPPRRGAGDAHLERHNGVRPGS